MTFTKFLMLLMAVAGLGLASNSSAMAQTRIKAVVNNEPVTTNEVQQRARFLHLIAHDTPNATLEATALEELVDERLRFQEAKRRKIEVSEAQVDAAFANIGARVHLTPDQLRQALGQSGIEVATLRQRLKGQILWQQMVMQRFQQSVSVSDQDVVKALQKQGIKEGAAAPDQQTNEYSIQEIVFVVPASAGKAGLDARIREAEQMRAKFTGCDTLLEQAKAYKETVVKNMGKRTEDELPPIFVPLLTDTPAGKLTKAVPTPQGAEMLAVCDKRVVAGNLVERSKVENEIREQQGQVLARQYTQELRRFAVIEYK